MHVLLYVKNVSVLCMIYAGSLLSRKTSRSHFIEIDGNVIANKSTSQITLGGVASARADVEFILSNNECPRAFIGEYLYLLYFPYFRSRLLWKSSAFSGWTSERPKETIKTRAVRRTFLFFRVN